MPGEVAPHGSPATRGGLPPPIIDQPEGDIAYHAPTGYSSAMRNANSPIRNNATPLRAVDAAARRLPVPACGA